MQWLYCRRMKAKTQYQTSPYIPAKESKYLVTLESSLYRDIQASLLYALNAFRALALFTWSCLIVQRMKAKPIKLAPEVTQ